MVVPLSLAYFAYYFWDIIPIQYADITIRVLNRDSLQPFYDAGKSPTNKHTGMPILP